MSRNNPYQSHLEARVAEVLSNPGDTLFREDHGMRHIAADNDWVYREMAHAAHLLAQAWASPLTCYHQAPEVINRVEELVETLLAAGPGGRWWSGRPGSGDANIDRFTLLPLAETGFLLGHRLRHGLQKALLEVLEAGTAHQVQSYAGARERGAGEYPNMDAYFMVLLVLAARLLDRADHHRMAFDYLGHLENCLLPDGGFLYYKGTNECEGYHQINVLMLVRFWEVTHSARALELVRKTLPYYPNVVEPSGVAEHFTDPYWKHYWNPLDPAPLDVLATLFPEEPLAATHRWLANRLHDAGAAFKANAQALRYWVDEPGTPPPERALRYDASIRGPRGRFGPFSWAGTTGDYLDTYVGALHSRAPGVYTALQAAGVEVLLEEAVASETVHRERHARCAYVTGRNGLRQMIVGPESAALAVRSGIYPGTLPWDEGMGDCGWVTQQAWLFTPERMVGLLSLRRERADAPALRASLYFRLGGRSREVAQEGEAYTCGDLTLRAHRHDFPHTTVAPAYAFFLDHEARSVEIRFSGSGPAHELLVELCPAGTAPATVERMEGPLFGFTVAEASGTKALAFNAGAVSHPLPPAFRGEGRHWREGRFIGAAPGGSHGPVPDACGPGGLLLVEG